MINLLYCGNDYVGDGVLTGLLSILMRSKPDTYHVYIFTMTLTRVKETYTPIKKETIEKIQKVLDDFAPGSQVIPIDVTDLYENNFKKCPNEGAYCSPYTLLRLFADMVPQTAKCEKLLYLDCDLMFNRDIHLLYDINIDGYEYASASDHYGKYLIHPGYTNAGVLLFNMEECKKTGLFECARGWIKRKKLIFADQSALIRSTTRRKHLPQRFNDQKFLHKHTVVRHFSKRLFWLPYPHTDNIKQWDIERVHKVFKYHCFDDIYEEYLKRK